MKIVMNDYEIVVLFVEEFESDPHVC